MKIDLRKYEYHSKGQNRRELHFMQPQVEILSYDNKKITVFRIAHPFTKEAVSTLQSYQKLNHPNVLAVYDCLYEGDIPIYQSDIYSYGTLSIFTEYTEGKNIEDLVQQSTFTEKHALQVAITICEVLKYAESLKLFHYGLEPKNIYIEKGVVKVSGWMDHLVIQLCPNFTMCGLPKISYTPRSLIEGNLLEDSLVYSICALLYYMLCGKDPYFDVESNKPFEIAKRRLAYKLPIPLEEVNPQVSYQVCNVVYQGMYEKKRRYQNYDELKKDLEALVS